MSALQELAQALQGVGEQLEQAHRQLVSARRTLCEAEAALVRIDPDHPEAIVPPALARAGDQFERTLTRVEHTTDTLRGFVAQL